jgi:NifU-like protein involved in Fe-S cluster formation
MVVQDALYRSDCRRPEAAEGYLKSMADLDDIYNERIFELAAAVPHAVRLEHPQATARAHSKLCGSTVEVEIGMDGDRISDFGQTVKACLLGQASAAIVGREIVGTPADEFRTVAATMRRMLKDGGPRPEGRWADLGLLEPVKDYPHRHASTLLVFDAVERALDQVQGGAKERGPAVAPDAAGCV